MIFCRICRERRRQRAYGGGYRPVLRWRCRRSRSLQGWPGDPVFQKASPMKGAEHGIEHSVPIAFVAAVILYPAGAPQKRCNIQQFPRVQHTAALRPAQRGQTHPLLRQRTAALQAQQHAGRAGLLLQTLHILHIRLRQQCTGFGFGRLRRCLGSQFFQNSGQLQRAERFFK